VLLIFIRKIFFPFFIRKNYSELKDYELWFKRLQSMLKY
jgi:hypothetical protein